MAVADWIPSGAVNLSVGIGATAVVLLLALLVINWFTSPKPVPLKPSNKGAIPRGSLNIPMPAGAKPPPPSTKAPQGLDEPHVDRWDS